VLQNIITRDQARAAEPGANRRRSGSLRRSVRQALRHCEVELLRVTGKKKGRSVAAARTR
jgi:hypothetical protein